MAFEKEDLSHQHLEESVSSNHVDRPAAVNMVCWIPQVLVDIDSPVNSHL